MLGNKIAKRLNIFVEVDVTHQWGISCDVYVSRCKVQSRLQFSDVQASAKPRTHYRYYGPL